MNYLKEKPVLIVILITFTIFTLFELISDAFLKDIWWLDGIFLLMISIGISIINALLLKRFYSPEKEKKQYQKTLALGIFSGIFLSILILRCTEIYGILEKSLS